MVMVQEIFKKVCSRFPKGVTVVTARRPGDGLPVGMTVSAFTGVSLDPPTILVCLRLNSSTTKALLEAPHFAVNVLSEAQRDVSQQFATCAPERRFAGMDWTDGRHSVPILRNTVGHFLCERGNAIMDGDHCVLFGRVLDGRYDEGPYPLVYWGSSYQRLTPHV